MNALSLSGISPGPPDPLAGLEELEDRQHPTMVRLALRQVELAEDAADVLLDGSLGNEDLPGDARIGRALSHQAEDLALARRQDVEGIAPAASHDELADEG